MRRILSIALLLFAAPLAHAAVAFSQAPTTCHTSSSVTTFTCTFAGPIPAGATLVAFFSPQNSTGTAFTISVADATNGAWTSGVQCFSAFNTQANMFYFANSAAVAGTLVVTVTSGTAAAASNLAIAAYTGVNTGSPFDAGPTCSSLNSSTVSQVGPTLTTTAATDMLVQGNGYSGNAGTVSVSSPYTIRLTSLAGVADDLPGTTGSQTGPTFTFQFSGTGYVIGAALKQAGGAPATTINPFWFGIQ